MIPRVIVAVMDVYLVPTGPELYELYCESPEEPPVPHPGSSSGLFRKLQERFGQVLLAVEHEYERERAGVRVHRQSRDGLVRRLRSRTVRWLVERVAEQRLLWRLRGQERVRALYPAHLDAGRALAVIRRKLESDADRHSRWLVLDGIGLLVSGLLAPLPGPNMFAYYFIFRVVGQVLAIRGARHGLHHVAWDLQASVPLERLNGLDSLPPAESLERVRAIERELGLSKLARFFERIVAHPA
jgi:hypothetical protein